jgi:pimeloyl-ACP methyl ester carboxylesterase
MVASPQHITVNGKNVRYYEAGQPHNRTLLLLHGGFGDARLNWLPLMPLLADEYHLVAPDLPGYGESEPLAVARLDALVDWAHSLMNTLGLDQAALVGNAFGGLIARLLATAHPIQIPALVLVNGGVIPAVPGAARLLARVPVLRSLLFNRLGSSASSRSGLSNAIYVEDIITDAFVQEVRANTSGLGYMMRVMTASPPPQEKTPRVPVLIVWGEEDGFTPVEMGERIRDNIPGASLSVLAECGHMPHLEVPDVFAFQVKNFLNDIDRRRGPV